jgi:hypothetical protein
MRIFRHGGQRKCAYAPYIGKITAKFVKNWRMCANPRPNSIENEQKRHLCAFFGMESEEDEHTPHNLEGSKLFNVSRNNTKSS